MKQQLKHLRVYKIADSGIKRWKSTENALHLFNGASLVLVACQKVCHVLARGNIILIDASA